MMDCSKPYVAWTALEKFRARHSFWWSLLTYYIPRFKVRHLLSYIKAQTYLYGWKWIIGTRKSKR